MTTTTTKQKSRKSTPYVYGHTNCGYTIPEEHWHKYNPNSGGWDHNVAETEWVPGDPLPGLPWKQYGRELFTVKTAGDEVHDLIDDWDAQYLDPTEDQLHGRPSCDICEDDLPMRRSYDYGASDVIGRFPHQHTEWCEEDQCSLMERSQEEHDDLHLLLTRSELEPWG